MRNKSYISSAKVDKQPALEDRIARLDGSAGTPFVGGDQQDRIYGTVPVRLFCTRTGGPTTTFDVVDDVAAAASAGLLEGVTLRVHLKDWSPPDEIEVAFDGWSLPPSTRSIDFPAVARVQDVRDPPCCFPSSPVRLQIHA